MYVLPPELQTLAFHFNNRVAPSPLITTNTQNKKEESLNLTTMESSRLVNLINRPSDIPTPAPDSRVSCEASSPYMSSHDSRPLNCNKAGSAELSAFTATSLHLKSYCDCASKTPSDSHKTEATSDFISDTSSAKTSATSGSSIEDKLNTKSMLLKSYVIIAQSQSISQESQATSLQIQLQTPPQMPTTSPESQMKTPKYSIATQLMTWLNQERPLNVTRGDLNIVVPNSF